MARRFLARGSLARRLESVCALGAVCTLLSLVVLARPATAQWEGGGPEGGWVMALLHPFGPSGVLYAGTYGGGVWRSDDGGRHWESAMTDRGSAIVRDLEFGPDTRNSIYAATEDQGVLRVESGGRVWTPVNTGLNTPFLPITPAVAVHPGHPSMISVATEQGVFTSRDRGNSYPDSLHWRPGIPMVDVKVSPLAPLSIFALSPEQLFFTPDRGKTVSILADQPTGQLVDLALWPGALDSMVAVGRRGQVLQFVQGQGFVNIGPTAVEGAAPVFHHVEVLERQRKVIVAGSDQGVFESSDRGATWQRRSGGAGARTAEVWAVEAASDTEPALLLGSFTRGLLYESAPGLAWEERNTGLLATWARGVDVSSSEWLCGDVHGRVHRSQDGGVSWQSVTGDLNTLQVTTVRNLRSGPWLAGTLNGLHRSADRGAHWQRVALPPGHRAIHRLLQGGAMADAEVWATTDRGVLRSLDGGQTWQEPSGLGNLGGPVFTATISPLGRLVFGVNNGALVHGPPEGPFESFLPAPQFGRFYRGLAFVGVRSLLVTSALRGNGGGGVVYRVAGLGSPSVAATDLTDRIFALEPVGGDAASVARSKGMAAVVALPGVGLLYTEDAGLNWLELADGLPTPRIERVAIEQTSQRVVVSTLGRGVWVRDLPQQVATQVQRFAAEVVDGGIRVEVALSSGEGAEVHRGVDDETLALWREVSPDAVTVFVDEARDARDVVRYELRSGDAVLARTQAAAPRAVGTPLRLLANVPNPFNPSTNVRFESSGGTVRLDVFDLRGRRVRRLFEGRVNPGSQSLLFDGLDDDGRELASGVYVLRVQQDDRHDARRVTLVR